MTASDASSTGGAAGASGVAFENQVFAWCSTALLAERQLLTSAPFHAGSVCRVGAQTGFPVDDIAIEDDRGGFVLFQAKANLRCSKRIDSPLAKALDQVVEQFHAVDVPGPGGHRAFDPARDAVVICTNNSAPSTIRQDLKTAVERAGTKPVGTSLTQGLNKPQTVALETTLAHLRRGWTAGTGTAPTDEDLRDLLRCLHVVVLHLESGQPDYEAARSVLGGIVPVGVDATVVWDVLVSEGVAASTQRQWRDRPSLARALGGRGVVLEAPARVLADVQALRDVTQRNLVALGESAALPVESGTQVERVVTEQLLATCTREPILITGDAGAGKSGVAHAIAVARAETEEVVVLTAADVAGANRLNLSTPLDVVFRAWEGPPATLIIDGFDALRGAEDRRSLANIVGGLRGSRWQTIASVRTFDALNSLPLRKAFAGASPVPGGQDPTLPGAATVRVDGFSDAELDQVRASSPKLATFLASADPGQLDLLRNPFNLRLACELVIMMVDDVDALYRITTRIDLLELYWRHRVVDENGDARHRVLALLCEQMVSTRSLSVAAVGALGMPEIATINELVSAHVLTRQAARIQSAPGSLSFAHNLLFDYAVALYVLEVGADVGLVERLTQDPSLPLVIRPSFDLMADVLWAHDREEFWRLAIAVAASPHVLASIALAGRAAHMMRAEEDLAPLAPGDCAEKKAANSLLPRQELSRHLIGSVRTPSIVPDVARAVLPMASLACAAAANAAKCYADGAIAADTIMVLERRSPLLSTTDTSFALRAGAVAHLLDGCRQDPVTMEPLAGAACRAIKTVAASTDVRASVREVLHDEAALAQWGGTVLTWLAEAVPAMIVVDRGLAAEIAQAVIHFDEARDEQVALGGGAVLTLHESRQQQARHGIYVLTSDFGALSRADLELAATILCDLAEESTYELEHPRWPLTVSGAQGQLENGFGFAFEINEVDDGAIPAFANAFDAADPSHVEKALAVLVSRLRNATAWAEFLTSGADRPEHGRRLLPALESGSLLVHPETSGAAAQLMAEAARSADEATFERLEQAVAAGVELADALALGAEVGNNLLRCLPLERMRDDRLKRRRVDAGETPPSFASRSAHKFGFADVTVADRLKDAGVDISDEMIGDAEHLAATLDGATDQAGRQAARAAFAAATRSFTAADLPEALKLLLVRAATRLTEDPEVVPDSEIGAAVLEVLVAGSGDASAGQFLK